MMWLKFNNVHESVQANAHQLCVDTRPIASWPKLDKVKNGPSNAYEVEVDAYQFAL